MEDSPDSRQKVTQRPTTGQCADSALNGMSTSNPYPQESGNSVEEEAEGLEETEVVGDSKELV